MHEANSSSISNAARISRRSSHASSGTSLRSAFNVGRIRIAGIFVHSKYFAMLLTEFAFIATVVLVCYMQAIGDNQQAGLWIIFKSLFTAFPFTLCFAGLGLYSSRQTLNTAGIFARYVVAAGLAYSCLVIVQFLVGTHFGVRDFPMVLAVAIFSVAAVRSILSFLLDNSWLRRRVLLVGNGNKAKNIGLVARDPNQRGFDLMTLDPALEASDELCDTVRHSGINEIVVAFDDRRRVWPTQALLDCRLSGIDVIDVLDFLERETGMIPLEHLQPSWLIFTPGFEQSQFYVFAKRSFDIVVATALILIFSPLMIAAALAIKLDKTSPGPIIYRQIRVGLSGKPFEVFKFRSMRTDAEKGGQPVWATQNDPRVTKTGAIFRKYRIDELPQLFNVLLGTMSLVGPRPERPQFVEMLQQRNALYGERHRVKPGVTGWAQLRFPYTDNEDDSIQKLQYDIYYMKNQGFLFDFYILLQTIEVVLFGKGSR